MDAVVDLTGDEQSASAFDDLGRAVLASAGRIACGVPLASQGGQWMQESALCRAERSDVGLEQEGQGAAYPHRASG